MPMLVLPTQESPGSESEPSRVRYLGARDLLAIGDVVAGTYEVRAKIGEGGMGQVYEAWDRALGRVVALKVCTPEQQASLGKEARALAALRHPSIVAVHSFGEHEGMPYVVMERVPGKTLQAHIDARHLRSERFGIEESVEILIGIAEALAVVHGAGMAHRDVKPGNVLLAPGNRIVLADFGIFQPEIEVAHGLHCAGSPHYMAPEALAMNIERGLLHLVDVYALGVVAYQLLCGAVPYDDGNAMKVLWLHANAPVPDPRLARAETPPRLATLVREMLAKNPADRPDGMEGIAWQLRRIKPQPAPRESGCSVIIVEDNPATATILASIVGATSDRAQVRIARDALEALELALAAPPDLLVIDLNLPGMRGIELCRRLSITRALDRMTIVATSSHASASDIETIRQLGFVQYIPKGEALSNQLPALVRAADRRATQSSR